MIVGDNCEICPFRASYKTKKDQWKASKKNAMLTQAQRRRSLAFIFASIFWVSPCKGRRSSAGGFYSYITDAPSSFCAAVLPPSSAFIPTNSSCIYIYMFTHSCFRSSHLRARSRCSFVGCRGCYDFVPLPLLPHPHHIEHVSPWLPLGVQRVCWARKC